ncbi:MAG: AI-2E family transporter [Clostridia bacterium]|nr:AI-2E family transporter [Clostridia bacterium]
MRLDWKSCMRAGVSVVAVYLVISYWVPLTVGVAKLAGAGMPLVVGGAIAYVVNILMRFYGRNFLPYSNKPAVDKLRRPLCMLLAFATVVLMLYFVVRMILPELFNALAMIVEQLPGALANLYRWTEQKLAEAGLLDEMRAILPETSVDWQATVSKGVNLVISGVGGVLGATFSVMTSTFSMIVTLFLALVMAVYLLLGKEKLGGQIHRLIRVYLGEKAERKIFYFLNTMDSCFHSYIVGQCTEALILGSLCILGMIVFGFPYAVMIGTLVGFTALIPIAGAYIGAVVGAFMIFTVDPFKALLFILFLVILQQLEGNLIFPRVVGQSIGLPALWVLAAVTVGGGVAGVGGILLSVPLTATLYRLIKNDVNRRTEILLPLRNIPGIQDDEPDQT